MFHLQLILCKKKGRSSDKKIFRKQNLIMIYFETTPALANFSAITGAKEPAKSLTD